MKNIFFLFPIISLIIFSMNFVHAKAKPFAYSTEKDGKTIHLFGTLHFAVSLEEIPCHNEIAEQLNTSDLVFSEMDTNSIKLLKYLGKNIEKIWTASVNEQEEMLSHLSEHERESVNKITALIERQTAEEIQKIYSRFGIQFVDKEKEPFEALSPQIRELLLNRGVAVSENYVDYLYSIASALILKEHFSSTSLDMQIAKTAHSKILECI